MARQGGRECRIGIARTALIEARQHRLVAAPGECVQASCQAQWEGVENRVSRPTKNAPPGFACFIKLPRRRFEHRGCQRRIQRAAILGLLAKGGNGLVYGAHSAQLALIAAHK